MHRVPSVELALDLPVDMTEELDVAHGGLCAVVGEHREEARLERILGDEHAHLVRVRVRVRARVMVRARARVLGLGSWSGSGFRTSTRTDCSRCAPQP